MKKKTEVVIIGAGSAGLSALRRVQKQTDRYFIIDPGPLGTTCARTGCMPSKVLVHAAREFHNRKSFTRKGIRGAGQLSCDLPAVLTHVRELRDHFASGMKKATLSLAGDRLIHAPAHIVSPGRVRAGEQEYDTKSIVIAAGSHPFIPDAWDAFRERILTSDTLFEQQDLPGRIAVVGLGPIGLELGQALSRLGIEVAGFDMQNRIGGLTDPGVNRAAREILGAEFPLYLGEGVRIHAEASALRVETNNASVTVDRVLAAMGVKPNLEGLGLENLGVELDERGLPPFNPRTMQVADLPVFIAGDVNGCRPILHEALDEGFIAGNNAAPLDPGCFCRRVPLKIVFSDPQIAGAGPSREKLENFDFVTGKADFSDQSRAMVEGTDRGMLHVYADRKTARLLGAEMIVPGAEHLAHLIALAIQNEMTVPRMLQAPCYHPTLEEGLRTALRDAARQLGKTNVPDELMLCESCPEEPVC